jgi:adenylylsulfate kinase
VLKNARGLHKKVCASEIKNMTDISAPYEAPENPDIEIKTESETIEVVLQSIVYYIILKLLKNNE